jgi:TP901 family phage tail tape measure protein
MAEFDVGLNGAQQQVAALVSAVHGLGKSLDQTEFKSKGLATEVARAMSAMDLVYDRLHRSMQKAGDSSADINKALEHAKVIAQNVFASVAASNLKATVQAQAYTGSLTELQRVLNDTQSKNTYVRWQQKTAQLTNNLIGENAHLQQVIASLTTEEGRRNANLKVQAAGLRELVTAEDRLINAHNSLTQASGLLDTALGRETANLRVQNAAKERLITLDTRIQANSEALRASIANLSTEEGRQNAILKVQEQSKRSLLTADARMTASNSALLQSITALDGHLGKLNAQLKVTLQGKTAEVTADARLANSTQALYTKLEQLNTAKGHDNVLTQQAVATRKAEITEAARLEAKLAALQREYMSLNGGVQEQIAKMQQLIQARKAGITEGAREETQLERLRRTLASLNGGRQEEITKLNAQISIRRKAIVETIKQKDVVDEQAAALAREQAQLQKLQQQMTLASSARGAEITKLKQQIIEQERYNKLLNKTTLELLGFENAQRRASQSNLVGSQSAAMLRAGLSGLQTNIGMYTSATIVAAASTYALARALRSTVELGAEFTASMAKADAVMGTGVASWMPTSMEAMEAQVRALGQSTMYTASEVALGLVELGQAGLNAADSIMALKPALNLAMIGGISMAESADMATNVMMTFGMQAKDLTDIVDLMATAASQSNTNVQQLANALTYAGPAAHTAGISMKDTTAAVEALSNTGIKASRAGTSLRKLFVSLLNPTKKGQQMMAEYGISVTDLEGKTRSLTDILGQLNKALKGVGEGERLGAIQDLVGLYATSSVAALVEQAGEGGNLEHLRRQLDDTAGAAEEMRGKMENSLKFDWKQVLSAFEEAQLQLFDAHEYQLRVATAKLSTYLIELTKPAAEIKDQYGNVTATFSHLDLMLQNGKELATGLGIAIAAALSFKMTGALSASLTALSVDSTAAAARLKVLAVGMADGTRGTLTLSGALNGLYGTLGRAVVGTIALRREIGLLGTIAVGSAKALGVLATAGRILSSAFGWVSLIAGIGYAIYEAFGQDSQAEILKQQAGVESLKTEYMDLKKAIDETAKARERAALVKQQDTELAKLGTINERQYEVEGAIGAYEKNGLAVPQALKDALYDTQQAAAAAGKAIQDASRELDKLNDPAKRGREADLQIENGKRLAELTQNVADKHKSYQEASGRMRLAQMNEWAEAQRALDTFKASLVTVTQVSEEATDKASAAIRLMKELKDEQLAAMGAHAFDKNASSAVKLAKNAKDLADAQKALDTAVANNDGSGALRAQKEIIGLTKANFDLKKEVSGTAESYNDVKDSIADLTRTDAERLARAKQQLAELTSPAAQMTAGTPEMVAEGDLKRAQEELKLRQQIKQIETSMASQAKKDGRPAGKTQSEKDLEAAKKAFDELQKKSDPLAASLANVAKKTEQLDLLLAAGKITAEDRTKVLAELRKEHIKLTLEQDKNYQSLLKLKESYGESPFSAATADLAEMGRLLEAGTMSLSRYTQMYDAFQKKQKEKVLDGLPTGKDLNISSGQSGFNPFGEFINTANEVGQGQDKYATRKTDLDVGLNTALMNQDDTLAAQLEAQRQLEQQMSAQEHAAAMQKIVQDDLNTRKALQQQFNTDSNTLATAQQEFASQSQKMLAASMLGSMSDIFGQFAAVGEEATTAQKLAFIAQKALAVAQIILYTEVAAQRANAELPVFMGLTMAQLIRAQGYGSAALVGSLAIGQLAGGGSSSSGGGASMYDTGGTIPYNRVGIVGEYGPELVSGPAHVTGRGASSSKLASSDSGSGGGMSITLAPVFNVGSDQVGDNKDPTMLSKIFGTLFMKYITDALRPNGLLDTWYRSKRGG